MQPTNTARRRLMQWVAAAGGLFAVSQARSTQDEQPTETAGKHKLVYQCNKADKDYLGHLLFSAGEMVGKYAADIEVVIACFGPGIHLLAQFPERPIDPGQQARAASLAEAGVAFHACGNTMKSLNWSEEELLGFAEVVPIGIDDIMLLQEQGFAYVAI